MKMLAIPHDHLLEHIRAHAEWAEADKAEYTGPKPPNHGAVVTQEWWNKVGNIVTRRAEAAARMLKAAEEFEKLTQEFYGMGD